MFYHSLFQNANASKASGNLCNTKQNTIKQKLQGCFVSYYLDIIVKYGLNKEQYFVVFDFDKICLCRKKSPVKINKNIVKTHRKRF